jgi:predicted AAA+ superfamily ATPase
MFDEWQKIPDLWDYIRAEIDARGGRGHFIITGSTKPIEDKNCHSDIGRMKRVLMRPVSLYESNDSASEVSSRELFYKKYAESA